MAGFAVKVPKSLGVKGRKGCGQCAKMHKCMQSTMERAGIRGMGTRKSAMHAKEGNMTKGETRRKRAKKATQSVTEHTIR